MVLGDRGGCAAVEYSWMRNSVDRGLCPGSDDGVHDGCTKGVVSFDPQLDLLRLRNFRELWRRCKYLLTPTEEVVCPIVHD